MKATTPVSGFTRCLALKSLFGGAGRCKTLALALLTLSVAGAVQAATGSFSTTPPALGPNDISSLVGHVTGGSPANGPRSNVGGAGNNTCYMADDQMVQGQTFRTGSNPNGYQLTAVTLRAVTYETYALVPDIDYTIRIVNPSGSTLSVLAQETAFVPADAPGNFPTIGGGDNPGPGSGSYITFTFDAPVVLSPNTTYGFDVGGGSVRHYWEMDGRSWSPGPGGGSATDPYTSGTAYSTGVNGSGDTTMTNRAGDRVFVVALIPADVVIPPTITMQPKSVAFYAGRAAVFTSRASGSPTLGYRWRKNGVNLNDGGNISGAFTDTLRINNVSTSDNGAYTLYVTNSANSATSAAATLTVVTPPAPGNNYAYAIFTNNALAQWRLNERSDPSTNPPAYDYMGGGIGTYEIYSFNGYYDIAGPRPSAFPGFESSNTALQCGTDQSWVTVPGLNVNTNTVTMTAWIYPNGDQWDDVGVFWTRSGGTTAGMGYGGTWTRNPDQLMYTWNGEHYDFVSGLVIPSDQWSFIAVVIEPTRATLYLGTGGVLTNRVNSPVVHAPAGWTGNSRIGGDPSNVARTFGGIVDEVAVFKRALTLDEVNVLYGIGRGVVQALPPVISSQPGSQSLYANRTARFSAVVSGSAPLTYQWRKDGVPITDGGNISGAQTAALTIANVGSGNTGSYTLVVTNSAGAATSTPPATLTIVAPSGKAYEATVVAGNPVAYYRLNETGDPAGGTMPAFNYLGGANAIYGPVAQPGAVGPQEAAFAEFEAANTAVLTAPNGSTPSWVTLPPLNLNTNTVTITAWIYPNDYHNNYEGLLTTRNGTTPAAGLHFTSDNQLGYVWNGGHSETWSFMSELRPPVGEWSFVALVINPTNAAFYLYNTNALSTTNNAITHTSEAWDGNAQLGGDQETANWRIFNGIIDEVAVFNYAFTPTQVLDLYNSAFQVPLSPVSITIERIGTDVRLTWPRGTLLEATSLGGQWTTNNANSPYTFTPTSGNKFYRVQVQ